MATLIEFLVRVRPDSKHKNPACIKNTNPEERMIQRISKFVLGIEFLIPENDKRIGKNSLFFRDLLE